MTPTLSRYEANVRLQPRLIAEILDAPLPSWMQRLRRARVHFVGVGSSYHGAEIAKILWRRLVSPQAEAAHSFEFARLPQPVGRGDVVVLLSHRGSSKSFTVDAARKADRAGAVTVAITGLGAVWNEELDHKLECCSIEDTGAFTKSFTTTMAWIARWAGDGALASGLRKACAKLEAGPKFPALKKDSDLVLLGDLEREWVARETALKLLETSFVRARPFGLEEFLHGPHLSVGKATTVVAFTDGKEPRWGPAFSYLKALRVPVVEVGSLGLPRDAAWLGQVFWGQRLALDACRRLRVDPDDNRKADRRYAAAIKAI